MPTLLAVYKNILETGTVTLTAGTAHASFPLVRLYDRGIGRLFKITAAVTLEVRVDQGASGNIAIDRMIIPAGHNLDGMTCDIQHSPDGSVWTDAVTQWVQSGSGLLDKVWSSLTKRYWRFKITTPASAPQFHELFFGPTFSFAYDPEFGWVDDVDWNVENRVTSGGQDRFCKYGDEKEVREYILDLLDNTEKANIKALRDACAGTKPLWIYDMTGQWLYMKLDKPTAFPNIEPNLWKSTLALKEVLP